MQRIAAEWVGPVPGLRLGHDLAPLSLEPVVRYRLLDGVVSVLDEQLQPIRRLDLDVPPTAKLLAATPDLATVVVTDTRSVIVITAGGPIALDVAAADSATLLPGGRLLVTAPMIERQEHQGREYDTRGEHLVVLVDLGTGRILDQAVLDVADAGVIAVPHPHDGSVVLDAGMGQDGSAIYAARVAGDRITVELIAEDVVSTSFAPSGDRLLLMPHPSFDDEISLLEWPSGRTVARLHADDLALEEFAFDLYGCFLSDKRILVQTSEHGLLLCSGELRPVAWISLNPPSQSGDVEVSMALGVTEDVFAADLWDGESSSATVWRIPPLDA
ncbi:hypothetical protein MILUP08_45793 [Micromonospora lupini str. Lupac 08]|uniref:Uncharacterized protein n=1 Tax=Micromonospora lupini str. Lupac 08 TaxID=1150864 RepID=I0LAQ2_9ACTN|nr:hypothetical protein MILUP08_45793 [Micromonospora lupini str. Lupac 08]